MNKPKISVLMPVYNAQKYLKEAIDSILNQTFKDFEFIIINDASPDKSKQIIMSYQDSRIRYFENNKNLGVAKTLNKGLELAKAKYVARMDADDISSPQRLAVEYGQIMKDNNIALVASFYEVIDEKGGYLYTVKDASSAEEIFYTLQFRNCLGHPTVIFNKEIILNEFHGYHNREAEDYDLWLRVAQKYKILKMDRVLHQLRISSDSRVSHAKDKIMHDANVITQQNLESLIQKPVGVNVGKILAEVNPLDTLPENIQEVLKILSDTNISILAECPSYLSKMTIKKYSLEKVNIVKLHLLMAHLFNSRFGAFFRYLYQLFRHLKYRQLASINGS